MVETLAGHVFGMQRQGLWVRSREQSVPALDCATSLDLASSRGRTTLRASFGGSSM